MRLRTQLAPVLLCLFLAGCSSSTASHVNTITLNTEAVPENLSVYVNDEPQKAKTNNGDINLSVPAGQTNLISVETEEPAIIYQVEVTDETKEPVSLKFDPTKNQEIIQQVSDSLNSYFKAVNNKKNAISYLSKDSILDPQKLYNHSYKSAVLYSTSFKTSSVNNKPELIVRVDTESSKSPSYTWTYEFRLLLEDGKWKIFHQRLLYEVLDGNLFYENEAGTYPGPQSPGPNDIVLSF
ncbi:hypothetical protein [Desulfitobacterium sp.]|uniref:hypothetical protein n=1 Tax=Desulfitobacterium sp. TaxID=49981 RepID=UPI002B1F2F54|nr:hypothetical protein [Desulfitobacterium sp.]MEA4902475.1 hypothetical protein [Desulfitobacterium sp.]